MEHELDETIGRNIVLNATTLGDVKFANNKISRRCTADQKVECADKECPLPDCETEFYQSKIVEETTKSNFTFLLLLPSAAPDIVSTRIARYSTLDFLVYAASAFALWLGVSLLNISMGAKKFLTRNIKKFGVANSIHKNLVHVESRNLVLPTVSR